LITLADLDALRTLEEYATLQGQTQARMKELDAEFGVKPLDPEAQTEWASLDEVDKELTARIAEAKARRDRLAALPESSVERPFTGRTIVTTQTSRVPEDVFALEQYRNRSTSETEMLQAFRDGAMFAVERAGYPNPQSNPDVERAHLQRLLDHADQPSPQNPSRELARLILATGHPTYLRAFTKYIQGRPLTPEEQFRAAAPLTVQTDATGGFAVPFYFDPTLLHVGAWTNVNPYRAVCSVKTIVGTDTYNAPTAAAFTVGRAAEAAAAVEGPGAIGQISAIVGKVHGFGGISMELLADRPDIVSELASLISEAKDTEEESIFTSGVGDALGAGFNPIGMFCAHGTSGMYTHVDTAGSNTLAAADALTLEAAVPIRHRGQGAVAMMSRNYIRRFQALETTGGQLFGGQYYNAVGFVAEGPTGNTGLRFLGYPLYEVPSAPATIADNDMVLFIGDPKSYYIVERAGMTVEVIPHIFDGANPSMPLGRRGIYAWWRNTAKPANTDGGRLLAILA
jgi:HK97 family phage major capsid protein